MTSQTASRVSDLSSANIETEVLVVGGGLSGLHTASKLRAMSFDVLLAEARSRLGGRIKTHVLNADDNSAQSNGYDLGPSWFWPGQQRMIALVAELGLASAVYSQFAEGELIYEDEHRTAHRGVAGFSMAGSHRIAGGLGQLIAALAKTLDSHQVLLGANVMQVEKGKRGLCTTISSASGITRVSSQFVVMAMPPRLAMHNITFVPELPATRVSELQDIPTWMAGQAKLSAVYSTRFWSDQGLSGDAISHTGPLAEIHDASPAAGGPFALFGFLAVPPDQRRQQVDEIQGLALAQLERLFGPLALSPQNIFFKDWASDPLTATPLDQNVATAHGSVTLSNCLEPAMDNSLIWSGSETARAFPERNNGYLEGALEASQRTVDYLAQQTNASHS